MATKTQRERYFLEACQLTESGCLITYSRAYEKGAGNFVDAIIPVEQFVAFAQEQYAESVHDTVDHRGEHVQRSYSKSKNILEFINQNEHEIALAYINSGKSFILV